MRYAYYREATEGKASTPFLMWLFVFLGGATLIL